MSTKNTRFNCRDAERLKRGDILGSFLRENMEYLQPCEHWGSLESGEVVLSESGGYSTMMREFIQKDTALCNHYLSIAVINHHDQDN